MLLFCVDQMHHQPAVVVMTDISYTHYDVAMYVCT